MAIVLHSSLRLEGYLTWMKNHQLDRGGLPSENIGEKIERKGGRLYIAAYISGCKCNCFRLILSSVQWCSLLLYGCFLLIWVSLFFNLRQLPSVIYIYAHVFNHLPKCFGICIHVIFFLYHNVHSSVSYPQVCCDNYFMSVNFFSKKFYAFVFWFMTCNFTNLFFNLNR